MQLLSLSFRISIHVLNDEGIFFLTFVWWALYSYEDNASEHEDS
jgi:hypothetical protein